LYWYLSQVTWETWRRKCPPLWLGIGYKVFYSSLRLEVTKFLCKLLAEAVLSGDESFFGVKEAGSNMTEIWLPS
jgi:hypothetical protein